MKQNISIKQLFRNNYSNNLNAYQDIQTMLIVCPLSATPMSDLLFLSLCLHKNAIHVLVQRACCLLHSGCTRVPSHPKSGPPFVACICFDIYNMLQPIKQTPTQHSAPYLFMAGTVCKVNYLIFKSYVIRLSSSIDFCSSGFQKTQV